MHPLSKLKEWYVYMTGSYRIPLFKSLRLHGLDVIASVYSIKNKFYNDVLIDNDGTTGIATRTKFRCCRHELIDRQQPEIVGP